MLTGDGQIKLLLKEVKKRQEHFLPNFLRSQREPEATGMRTPRMVSRSSSPPGTRGNSSLGKRKMSQPVASPQPMSSGQARENQFSMEVENVDICKELTTL
jgi:hypothetical protein